MTKIYNKCYFRFKKNITQELVQYTNSWIPSLEVLTQLVWVRPGDCVFTAAPQWILWHSQVGEPALHLQGE